MELLERESQSEVFQEGISYVLFKVAERGLVYAAEILLRYGADLNFEGEGLNTANQLERNTLIITVAIALTSAFPSTSCITQFICLFALTRPDCKFSYMLIEVIHFNYLKQLLYHL